MYTASILLIGLIVGAGISSFYWNVINKPHDCSGDIFLHGDELYLALTEEDKEAFKIKKYVTLKLVREKFKGFSE